MISAHRGGPAPSYPENCMATLRHTHAQIKAMLEVDVSMTKDSVLVLMHDATLDRTTTGQGRLFDQNWETLSQLRLRDNSGHLTSYSIPLLEDVLRWAKGRALISLDVKRGVPFRKVIEAVRAAQAEAHVVIITYTLAHAKLVHSLAPELMISANIRNEKEWETIKASGLPLSRIIAFTGTMQSSTELYEGLHAHGIFVIMGTMGNIDRKAAAKGAEVYQALIEAGVDIIATDHPLEVAEALGLK